MLQVPQQPDAPATIETAHVDMRYGFEWGVEARLETDRGHTRTVFAPLRVGVDRS